MRIKKGIKLLASALIFACLLILPVPAAAAPSVSARGAVLMDAKTGVILYQESAYARLPPASTTKIMTAILALENGDLNAPVTASRRAATTEGSSIWLREGETLTLREMLYGILLKSGNDASVAVAEHIAGQETEFVRRMNRKARELGACNTHFVNANGLPAPEHYSTAYDLAVITRYALNDPVFAAIVKTQETRISWPGETWLRTLRTTNKLLAQFAGADGVKTGTTSEAGQCLVASATRNGQQLIAVLLHSSNRWQEAAALLEYGFTHFSLIQGGERGALIENIPVLDGTLPEVRVFAKEDLQAVVPNGDKNKVRRVLELPNQLRAPIKAGQSLGSLKLVEGSEILAETELLAGDAVGKTSLWQRYFTCFLPGADR